MAEQPKPATGYPYTASGYPPPQSYPSASNPYPPPPYYPPPPPPQPNPAYYAADVDRRTSNTFRRFILGMIAVFLIFGAVIFIVWLVLRPEIPEFSVTAVAVPSFNFTSSNQLKANWDVTFTAYNRNKKMAVQYESVRASVSYGLETLADTTLSPFYQEKRNTTTVTARVASDSYVPDYEAGKLRSDRSAGNVLFNFRLLAAAQFRSGAWRTRWRSLRVYCYDVEINFGSNSTAGSLKSSPWRCAVYW